MIFVLCGETVIEYSIGVCMSICKKAKMHNVRYTLVIMKRQEVIIQTAYHYKLKR